jgi:FkbM family methyltransferase
MDIFKLIKKFIRQQRSGRIKKGIKCESVWYGNNYGGFYVCPSIICESSIVYSFGIGEDISFDKCIYDKHNCAVYAFDPTPKSINWIKKQSLFAKFHFYEFGLSDKCGWIDFYLPKNQNHVSGSITSSSHLNTNDKISVRMKTLKDIMIELNHDHIDLLKMDIEGSEYVVIENILKTNIPINQILIEFHSRFSKDGKYKTKRAIQKLKEYGYEIFAFSDSYEEVSFINCKITHEKNYSYSSELYSSLSYSLF